MVRTVVAGPKSLCPVDCKKPGGEVQLPQCRGQAQQAYRQLDKPLLTEVAAPLTASRSNPTVRWRKKGRAPGGSACSRGVSALPVSPTWKRPKPGKGSRWGESLQGSSVSHGVEIPEWKACALTHHQPRVVVLLLGCAAHQHIDHCPSGESNCLVASQLYE